MADPTTLDTGAATAAVPVGAIEQLLLFMEDGGAVLYLLVAISVLALTLIIAKLIQFWIFTIAFGVNNGIERAVNFRLICLRLR